MPQCPPLSYRRLADQLLEAFHEACDESAGEIAWSLLICLVEQLRLTSKLHYGSLIHSCQPPQARGDPILAAWRSLRPKSRRTQASGGCDGIASYCGACPVEAASSHYR